MNGNQVTITQNGTSVGTVTITATVTTICNTFTVQRTVYIGPVPSPLTGPYDPIQHTVMGVACTGQQYYFQSDSDPASTYVWTLIPPPGSTQPTYLFSGSTAYMSFAEVGCYTLTVAKTNSCGTVVSKRNVCTEQCYSGFTVMASPNPASDVLLVTIDNETADVKALSVDENIMIELYDFNTSVKQKQWSFKNDNNRFSLNLNGVPKGKYVLRVKKGNYSQSTQLIVN